MFGVRVLEESPIYGFFLNRYGDGWIYLPLEGNHPLEEERAVLQLFHTILAETNPRDGGDILEIASEDPPRLQDTGFPEEAEVDLLFHAARRLADKGLLEAVPNPNPRPKNFERNYGNTYFKLPANVTVPLADILCENCRRQHNPATLKLHHQCAERLNTALTKALNN